MLRKADGSVELYKDKHSLALGVFPGVKYMEYELKLLPGEGLFLYTDGVPEASNPENENLGNDRMTEALGTAAGSAPEQVLKTMKESLNAFVKDAEQFDDITMMCLVYNRKNGSKAD